MRIAVGGLLHETNTFASGLTTRADFAAPTGWPPLATGDDIVRTIPSFSVPAAGALRVLDEAGVEIVPTFWAMALPSGVVEQASFAALLGELVEALRAAGPVDGVYLDLHGAMASEADDDPEGTVVDAVRGVVGDGVPIAASIDPHANLSRRMAMAADFIAAYRTYPHMDMVETGARAARTLLTLVQKGERYAKAYGSVPYLLPLIAQATGAEPMKTLMQESVDTAPGEAVTVAFGFPLADVPDAGPALIAYAALPDDADQLLAQHLSAWNAAEGSFSASALSPGAAIAKARDLPPGKGPVILADVQDNPGAGGTNDTTGLLAALVDEGLQGALLIHIADAAAADAAYRAGIGARLDIGVGGKADPATGAPVDGPWQVAALGDGRFVGQGPMYGGNTVDMGPVACLEQNGVRVIVAGQRMQASEPALVRHLGIEPFDVPVLALKSSVHFRGAYQHVAREIILVAAPGLAPVELGRLTFCKARRRIAGRANALG